MPLWLLASISSSYDSSKIFTFQPGKGFTCISSIDEKDLGTFVDGVDGIDINKYFADKKDKSKNKLPTVMEKREILSKIKGIFANFKEKRENAKYLDDTIKSTVVAQVDKSSITRHAFQDDLQQGISEPSKAKEQSLSTEILYEENSIIDKGG